MVEKIIDPREPDKERTQDGIRTAQLTFRLNQSFNPAVNTFSGLMSDFPELSYLLLPVLSQLRRWHLYRH